jgi:hypothetical protein
MIEALGWAVIDENGYIDIRSVAITERSAKVNFLMVVKDVEVHHSMTIDEVEALWQRHRGEYGITPVSVRAINYTVEDTIVMFGGDGQVLKFEAPS